MMRNKIMYNDRAAPLMKINFLRDRNRAASSEKREILQI